MGSRPPDPLFEDELLELDDELEDEVPGKGSAGQSPVELVALHVEPAEVLQPTTQRTVVVSSNMPLPRVSSMIRLICLLSDREAEGSNAVFQTDQPPVGGNRLPNVPRY